MIVIAAVFTSLLILLAATLLWTETDISTSLKSNIAGNVPSFCLHILLATAAMLPRVAVS